MRIGSGRGVCTNQLVSSCNQTAQPHSSFVCSCIAFWFLCCCCFFSVHTIGCRKVNEGRKEDEYTAQRTVLGANAQLVERGSHELGVAPSRQRHDDPVCGHGTGAKAVVVLVQRRAVREPVRRDDRLRFGNGGGAAQRAVKLRVARKLVNRGNRMRGVSACNRTCTLRFLHHQSHKTTQSQEAQRGKCEECSTNRKDQIQLCLALQKQ